jgi:hypothetical protein
MTNRKVAWSRGQSHMVLPVRHDHKEYHFADLAMQERSSRAVKAELRETRPGRPMIVANPRRDDSRKYVRQSDGYVMSGWRRA